MYIPPTHPIRPDTDSFTDKVAEFHSRIVPANSVLIVTHDYPDPDCIASAFGIAQLLAFWKVPSTVITFGGFVGRAENRAMIRFLNISTIPFVLTDINDFDKIILVDSFPGKGNVSLPISVPIDAVFDHHPSGPLDHLTFFHDIRQDYGATSTIVTKYLLESNCPISAKLATALFFGIKTDTGDMRREVTVHDLECYKYLFDIMDHQVLARIENPDRDVEFFRLLHRAAESAVNYDNLGYTHLGNVSTPDYVAEMADLFHSLEKLDWMICSGIFKNQIFFSIRSKKSDTAGVFAEQLAHRLGGSGGGHARVAAGRIPIAAESANTIVAQFESMLKDIFNITNAQPEPLL